MKRKTWIGWVATTTLGAGLAAGLAMAAPPDGPGPMRGAGSGMHFGPGAGMDGGFGGMGMHPRMLERMADELGLSEAQRTKVKGLFEAARPGMEQLRERGRKNAERLRAAKPGDKNYDVVVAEVSRDAGEAVSQMVRDAAKLRAQVWAEFTPEQRTKLDAMQAKMRERMQERRERMGSPDGGRRHEGPRRDGPPPPAPLAPPGA